MARDFSILALGLIFIFVQIELNGFAIAPDLIGYILIAWGCHGLAQYTPSFLVARNAAALLIPLAAAVYVTPPVISQTLATLNPLLSIVVVWLVLRSIILFTTERERPDLADHGVLYRRIYVGVALFTFLVYEAASARPEAFGGFVGLANVAMLILLAFILRLLYAVKHDIAAHSVPV